MFDFFGMAIISLCSILLNVESKTKGNANTEIEKGIVISEFSVMTELLYCILFMIFLVVRNNLLVCTAQEEVQMLL